MLTRGGPPGGMLGGQPPSPWVTRFAPLVPRTAAVLDVACGSGRHLRHFLALGHDVAGVDIDTRGVADLAGRPRVEIVRADLEGGRSEEHTSELQSLMRISQAVISLKKNPQIRP